jgi:isoleucyl-tRNA synthetase
MPFKKVNPRVEFPKLEQDVLSFWRENKIFEKSVISRPNAKPFSFYDGPPFATGLPHYGHLLAGTIKDVIPRYKTMRGYSVQRIWGWDTHGLPIENIVEQELDIKTKLQIEEYGVDKFNEKCRTKVLKYAEEWKKIVERTGRWIDMDNAYLTMDSQFMESVWWVFSKLWKKGLIYSGHRVMPYCPRCSTSLSNFELGEGYRDKRDKAITLKFELAHDPKTYFLAWTTTPWTLPGNLALAVGPEVEYAKIEANGNKYILAKERVSAFENEIGKYKILETISGSKLVGTKYKPLFDYYKGNGRVHEVIQGDYVSVDDGTGIVHIAPAFGEEDYNVAKTAGIDFFMPVDDLGLFTIDVPDYAGKSVIEGETNEQIISDLGNAVFKIEEITHSYPHCWRCDTPLIYRAVDSYFVAVEKFKNEALIANKDILWVPGTIGKNRFAKLIESAPDWNISRNRFWGTPLPVWKCPDCCEVQVFGSIDALRVASGKKVTDLHLHYVQNIEVPCKCGGKAKLSGEVLDCWFESGSMPFASVHYPFENKERFEKEFPADFIAEGIDQTRGWFRSLLMLSVPLFGKSSYNSVVVNGTVLAEDGQKMSKKLNNYPDPTVLMDKYGADAMRFYLMGSPAVKAEDMRFSEKGVEEVVKKVEMTLWNSYSFFTMYASLDDFKPTGILDVSSQLDKWLLSITNKLILETTKALDRYELSSAVRLLTEYVDELSNWYIRRSRKRFWKSENDTDKTSAYETLYFALVTYTKLIAPFMPFIAEEVYQGLVSSVDKKAPESIHLTDWPMADKKLIDGDLDDAMARTRDIVNTGLSLRAAAGIKVRQPLATISYGGDKLGEGFEQTIAEEVNVKKVNNLLGEVNLDTTITPELAAEGIARDFIRFVQDGRKKANFNIEDRIETSWSTKNEKISKALDFHKKYIAKETLSTTIRNNKSDCEYSEEIKLASEPVWFGITRK